MHIDFGITLNIIDIQRALEFFLKYSDNEHMLNFRRQKTFYAEDDTATVGQSRTRHVIYF